MAAPASDSFHLVLEYADVSSLMGWFCFEFLRMYQKVARSSSFKGPLQIFPRMQLSSLEQTSWGGRRFLRHRL